MSRATSSLLAALLLLATALPMAAAEPKAGTTVPAEAAEPSTAPAAGEVIPGEVVVAWRDRGRASERAGAHALTVLSELGTAASPHAAVVSTNGRPVHEVVAELKADPAVAYAEPNYRVRLAVEPSAAVPVNDPMTGDQYSLDRMKVRDAWGTTRGAGNVIAVLDTGVQFTHPDLVGRLATGWNFVTDQKNATDDNGHGTWVSGIIAANANDAYGIAGISPLDYILPVKIMNREGTGSTAWLMEGILFAADRGADVINMSVGGFPYSQAVQDAVNYAWNKGAVLVGAAGNNRREESYYPASFANVLSVTATQVEDEFSHWSSYGPRVDVSAPGSSVLTTNCYTCTYADHDSWGSHTYISGTSFATPNVAGVVALLRAADAAASPQQIVDRLLAGVDDLGYPGWDNRYGLGRVNAARSLTAAGSTSALTAVGDGLEPNNSLAAARPIAIGTTVRPSIHPAGDVDTFAVDVPRMGRLDVRVTGVVDTRSYPWNKSSLPVDPIVELYATDGTLLRRVDAVWESGTELASLNAAGPMRVILRVANYYTNGNRATYAVSTAFVDEVPPRVLSLSPAPGAAMVVPSSPVTFRFSEPVEGVGTATVRLRTAGGTPIPATVGYDRATGLVRVTPAAVLPAATKVVLALEPGIVDTAGLSLASTRYAFTTMPGTTFVPARRVNLAAGSHVGHRFSSTGATLSTRSGSLSRASGASGPQRATFAALPGAWLYVENGMWAGTWLREGPRAHVGGTTELAPLAPTTRIAFRAGTHVGRRYDSAGTVVASRSATLASASGANVDAIAVINGTRHYRVVNGVWAGYWVVESAAVRRDGFVDRQSLPAPRRVLLGAGTHTAIAFDSAGNRIGARTATLSRPSGADVTAWAVVNGRAHVLVVNGIWAGHWMPEEDVLAYAP